MNYKTLDKQAVLDASLSTLAGQDIVTTLDVKNVLRQRGYWATQDAVSYLMNELADDNKLSWVDSGYGYRFYGVSYVQQNTAVNDTQTVATKSTKSPLSSFLTEPETCCYQCDCYTDPVEPMTVTGEINRNEARNLAAVILNIPYRDVRAILIV